MFWNVDKNTVYFLLKKINTHEKSKFLQFAKINTHEMQFFLLAKIDTREN